MFCFYVVSRATFKVFEMLAPVTTNVTAFRSNIEPPAPPQNVIVRFRRCRWHIRRVPENRNFVGISHPVFGKPIEPCRGFREHAGNLRKTKEKRWLATFAGKTAAIGLLSARLSSCRSVASLAARRPVGATLETSNFISPEQTRTATAIVLLKSTRRLLQFPRVNFVSRTSHWNATERVHTRTYPPAASPFTLRDVGHCVRWKLASCAVDHLSVRPLWNTPERQNLYTRVSSSSSSSSSPPSVHVMTRFWRRSSTVDGTNRRHDSVQKKPPTESRLTAVNSHRGDRIISRRLARGFFSYFHRSVSQYGLAAELNQLARDVLFFSYFSNCDFHIPFRFWTTSNVDGQVGCQYALQTE